MAAITYPSYAYNSAGQPALIVINAAAFAALSGPGTWALTPYPVPSPPPAPPVDSLSLGTGTFTATDTRLQQALVELRISNLMQQQAFVITEDAATQMRADVLANDASLTS
jgi:hypothetical protein